MQLENLKIHGENLKILKMRSNKSHPSRSDNVIKETGVFQTYSIAFSRFSNFHREFSNFPIAFCNVFSKINLINNNNNLRITNAAKTFNLKIRYQKLFAKLKFSIFCG
jgi:hypothetical protein